ncbi:peptidoglycan recognition protein family protein, partial [Lacrimispora algidixylanolytica]|uniref:peptidoglycan recognition protein family protein n=1 Tax=Lacrimispora algidixylanolytica TaxID=94868 RepID=UPI0011C47D5D
MHSECRNTNSLGIELCVRNKGSLADTSRDWYFEDATVQQAIKLTKELMAKYNIPADHVIRHHGITGKICPNPYVYNHTKLTWDLFKAALISRPAEYTHGWNQDKNGWWYADT